MYVANGICYADRTEIEISSVEALNDTTLLLAFNNGEKRLFNVNQLNGEAFEPLKEPSIFKNASVEFGVVTWLNGKIDCAPEYMYSHSETIA